MATQTPTPIQSSISTDLERELREIQTLSLTGPPGDLDDDKKRWLVVGICLHSILSPALRKYVDPVVTNLYQILLLSNQIDSQTQTAHLRKYGSPSIYLNYEAINNNKTTHGYSTVLYDYKVQNAVDLSKLFLQTHMAQYTGFDRSCDSSALFGMITKIDKFPSNVQTVANDVRSTIRNEWAHCNFTVWNNVKYVQSLQLIESFIYLLKLDADDEKQIIEELDKWRKNGTSFLQGYTISFEIVNEIRHKIQILVEYADVISKTADKEFGKVHDTLIDIRETFSMYDKRISTLENTLAVYGKALKEYGSLYESDVHEIKIWKEDSKYFIKTDVVPDIITILENQHYVLLTGVSGIGKTLTAQNIALQLCHEHRYSIVPCTSLQDIIIRYKENVRQVFFVDDMCGKYTANLNIIENWRSIRNRVKSILDKGMTKLLVTSRTEVFKEEIFQHAFDLFNKNAYNLCDHYSVKDKLVIATKYFENIDQILPEIKDIVIKNKFSPLMCFLFSRHKQFDINEFLSSPYDTFCTEWDNLKSVDTEKFCVLLLCVIYNGTINDDIFDISHELEQDDKKKLKDIFEWCKLNRSTSRSAIQAKINVCIDTYLILVDREYKVIHDKMFDFLCSYFGKTLLTPILKYADDKVICERVQLESLHESHGHFTIMVSEDDEDKYNKRIKTDLQNGKIHCCLNNAQMKYKEYRIKLRDIIKNLENNLITNLINSKDANGINAFIMSCLRGYDELVAFFISVGADVDCQNGFFTPLTAACHDGHLQTVEILLHKGSNINQTNTHRETPLYTACFEGHFNLVNLLIDKQADINKQNKYSHTPLYASCLTGQETIVSLLIDNGAKVTQCKDCLIVASLGGYTKIIEKLLSSGCGINSVDMKGKTALFIACEEGYTEIVKLLIDNNADIYIVDSDGRTPLHAACCFGNNDIVSILISKDSDVNMVDVNFETPLHKACRNGSLRVIQTLMNYGADIHKLNREEHTALYLANTESNIVDECILKALQEKEKGQNKGENISKSNKNEFQKQKTVLTSNLIRYGWTPLYEACVHGDIETAQSLIKNRADVNMKTESREMPLVAACQQGHGFLIQLLLEEGADVNEALCCAVQRGYDRTIKILLHKGGNIVNKGGDEKSFLALSCEQGFTKGVKILIENGVDFKERDLNGQTLLHVACNSDNVDLLQLLIDKSVDLTIPDKNGRYPLFVSLVNGFYRLSDFLIKKSCPIAISEEDTKTALILVFESGNNELSKLLVSNGYTENLSHFDETMLYHAYRLGLRSKVEILLRSGSAFKEKYKYGYTPRILADIGGNDDLSEYLQNSICSKRNTTVSNNMEKLHEGRIHCYAISNYASLQEYEHLIQACINGNETSNLFENLNCFRRICFDFFIEPNVSILFKQTPLCLEIRRGHTDVAKFLLTDGVNVNLTFEEYKDVNDASLATSVIYGYTPLFAACQRKNYEIVDMLLEHGANVDKALYDACREGYLDTVQFLLYKGANVNSISRYGQTALCGACIGGYSAIVKLLIHQGAGINKKIKTKHSFEALSYTHAAYLCGNHNIVQLLISSGASVNAVDHIERTLLHYACKEGNYTIVEILMNKGGNVYASDMFGITPLLACLIENEEQDILKACLFEKEEQYFSKEKWRLSQMHKHYFNQWEASKQFEPNYKLLTENRYKVIQLLIDNGADINEEDFKGRTPLSLARKIGESKLFKILLN